MLSRYSFVCVFVCRTVKEMLEKIAELYHNRSQLKLLNSEMSHLLDAADDEMTLLRSENDGFRRQVKALEQIVVDGQHVEAQLCSSSLRDDLDVKQSTEITLQVLEEECNAMKERNKKLIAEVQMLQQQREQDKMSLSKFSAALKNIEFRTEEAQLELQQRDEVIQQSKLQLKQAEETVEEYTNVIKLRRANQELRSHLEDREDEASLVTLGDLMEEKKASHVPGMSFAEELKLLASQNEIKSMMAPSMDSSQEETDATEPTSAPVLSQQTNRYTKVKEPSTHKVFVLCLAIIIILVIVAAGNHARYFDFPPIHNLWRSVHLILQPYFSVHYGALPPV
ncbi:227 kDa spindle- and centromere-associated protein-like isoform X2 [Hippocampus zosterae]|uniref:227 kDa spindle- and centromere-associated protein-like isoform X2 n=1 Tax=Hippocampus zosterae TaxID=109293 RepID=UPI00223D88E5|nr:227 kDa spindle- and centromere-associated protein-like isoform X2 [Hippocampus zosterae]